MGVDPSFAKRASSNLSSFSFCLSSRMRLESPELNCYITSFSFSFSSISSSTRFISSRFCESRESFELCFRLSFSRRFSLSSYRAFRCSCLADSSSQRDLLITSYNSRISAYFCCNSLRLSRRCSSISLRSCSTDSLVRSNRVRELLSSSSFSWLMARSRLVSCCTAVLPTYSSRALSLWFSALSYAIWWVNRLKSKDLEGVGGC